MIYPNEGTTHYNIISMEAIKFIEDLNNQHRVGLQMREAMDRFRRKEYWELVDAKIPDFPIEERSDIVARMMMCDPYEKTSRRSIIKYYGNAEAIAKRTSKMGRKEFWLTRWLAALVGK